MNIHYDRPSNMESQHLKRKSCQCCSWECVSKVFAYANLGLAVPTLLASIAVVILMLVDFRKNYYDLQVILLIATSVGFVIYSIISLIFAVFLYKGITRKQTKPIFAYFVYGLVTQCLAVVTTVCFAVFWHQGIVMISFNVVINCVYPLFLVAVWKTYGKYKSFEDDRAELLN